MSYAIRKRDFVQLSANYAIISADSTGDIVFWNLAAEEIFGYAESEIIGRSLATIIPERYRAAHGKG